MPAKLNPTQIPDVTSVRSLVTSVTALANHLALSNNAIYRWIEVNRIPGRHIVKVAAFYDVEIPVHLSQSDKKNVNKVNEKPAETLPTVLRVFRKEIGVDEAAAILGLHPRAVQLILTHWGDQFPLLYKTLTELVEERITVGDAATILGVTKYNVHALRRKYGLRPGPKAKAPPRPIVARKKVANEVALACIEGKLTLEKAQERSGQSWRTIHRAIANLSPNYTLIQLTHWPKSFRRAYSEEIERELPRIVPELHDFAQKQGLFLKKWPKYPEKVSDWRSASAKRMLIAVLSGEETLESIAAKRRAEPEILAGIFTSDLRAIGLTYTGVLERPVSFQIAVAELLIAMLDRKRKAV